MDNHHYKFDGTFGPASSNAQIFEHGLKPMVQHLFQTRGGHGTCFAYGQACALCVHCVCIACALRVHCVCIACALRVRTACTHCVYALRVDCVRHAHALACYA